jgi:hypothetical protein
MSLARSTTFLIMTDPKVLASHFDFSLSENRLTFYLRSKNKSNITGAKVCPPKKTTDLS